MIIKTKPFYSFNFLSWEAGRECDFHKHPYFQVIQVLDGRLEVDWGKGWKPIENNAVHVLPPDYKHRLKTDAGHRQFGMEFFTIDDDVMGLLDGLSKAFPEPAIQPMYFHKSWTEALSVGWPLDYSARLAVLNTLMDWTVSLIKAENESHDNTESVRLAELLKASSRRAINIDEIAQKLHWSRRKTQQVCKLRFACGIKKLHEKMRMEEASRLLLNTGLNVGEVAEACGYADIYGFSRTFARTIGMPPSAFRRKIKEGRGVSSFR